MSLALNQDPHHLRCGARDGPQSGGGAVLGEQEQLLYLKQEHTQLKCIIASKSN